MRLCSPVERGCDGAFASSSAWRRPPPGRRTAGWGRRRSRPRGTVDRVECAHYLGRRSARRRRPRMPPPLVKGATGVLALANGVVLQGIGAGAVGNAVGEVCFNTAMTGYQEILTDPSYMAQIVAFTFPR